MRLGLIGYGNIARTLLGVLAGQGLRLDRLEILARPGAAERACAALTGPAAGIAATLEIHETAEAFIAARPDMVAEVATHAAVREVVPRCLAAGLPCLVVSTGALADPATEEALRTAALAGGTGLTLVPGAIGGLDALSAARLSGITEATYTSRKPPRAWAGTPAEERLDLATLARAEVFYEGTARQAATDYPKNANVAATLALAGAGFERTRVRMIADPDAPGNIHEFTVRSAALDLTMTLEGKASPDNPKTSISTVYSVAREILNRASPIAI